MQQKIKQLFGNKWIRVVVSNVVLVLVGMFTNLLSNDISAASGQWSAAVVSWKGTALVALLFLNTIMQIALEPKPSFRTKAEQQAELRRQMNEDIVAEMRKVMKDGDTHFLSVEEVKAMLGLHK